MSFRPQIALIFALFSTGLLPQAALAAASKTMADIGGYEMMQAEIAALSPNELSLVELQRERQDLLRNRGKENPRIFKNKLTILNNKITYLEDEIKRTKPYVVRQRLVPLTDKPPVRAAAPAPKAVVASPAPAPAPVAAAAPRVEMPRPAPVAVDMRPAAASAEPSSQAAMTWTPNVTSPKTASGPAERFDAAQATVRVRVEPQPVSGAQTRAEAQAATVREKVELRPASEQAERAVTQTLPVRVQNLPAQEISQRSAAQEQALPVRPKLALAELGPATAQPGKGARTGADWKKMGREDKEIYILSVMGNLSRRDVYLMKPYNFYIDSIDRAVEKNPDFEQEFVHRILMTTAYENEPDTRKDLEKVWK